MVTPASENISKPWKQVGSVVCRAEARGGQPAFARWASATAWHKEKGGHEGRLKDHRVAERGRTVFGKDGAPAATMLLNGASIKQSYAAHEVDYAGLYGSKSA
jgi:hypothetical protein